MPLEAKPATPRLYPSQTCFVVEDVAAAAHDCAARFGWGPFQQFTAPIADAHYRGWSGRKVTEVALGMAGQVQVELIHVHEGRDAIATYQAQYGTGFQHLGIGCRSREDAVSRLGELGAAVDSLDEYGDVRIAFVDVPTGPAMFELLQQTSRPDVRGGGNGDALEPTRSADVFAVDRATIVTADMTATLPFYAAAFGWADARSECRTLRHPGGEARIDRFVGRAGALQLELLAPQPGGSGDDPYSLHLARGRHGLVHAGGAAVNPRPAGLVPDPAGPALGHGIECEWIEDGESFALYDWAGGRRALQVREAA